MTHLVLILLPVLASQLPVPGSVRSDAVVYARLDFRKGNFRDAIAKLVEAQAKNELQDPNDKFEAALLQGLSYIYLGEAKNSVAHFQEILLTNPDFDLDPLTYGEAAKRELDAVRALPELKEALDKKRAEIREAKQVEDEARRIAEENARKRRELAALPDRLPSIEKHNPLLNILPFGVPQIEQERIATGVVFAVAQGAAITVSILTYIQVQSYIESDGKVSHDNMTMATNWKIANWISFGATVAVYLGVVIDAFVHYNERTVTMIPRDEYLKLKQDGSTSPALPPATPPAYPKPSTRLFLAPTPGGAAVGLSGVF